MKRKYLLLFLLLVCAALLLTACKDEKTITAEYVKKIEPEAKAYFEELAGTAIGEVPEKISIEFRYPSKDFAKMDVRPVEDIVSGYPVLLVGYSSVTEAQLSGILKEAAGRGIVVHFFFNGDTSRIYKAEGGSVTVDEMTGRDGGAGRIETEFVFDEPGSGN